MAPPAPLTFIRIGQFLAPIHQRYNYTDDSCVRAILASMRILTGLVAVCAPVLLADYYFCGGIYTQTVFHILSDMAKHLPSG